MLNQTTMAWIRFQSRLLFRLTAMKSSRFAPSSGPPGRIELHGPEGCAVDGLDIIQADSTVWRALLRFRADLKPTGGGARPKEE